MIVGLTGRMASGKGTVADVLKAEGFGYYSLSDVIRDEIRHRGLEESRSTLTDIGNELRVNEGPSTLAVRILKKLTAGQSFVVDSIRNPAEVDALRAGRDDFVLLCVEAPAAMRFERLRSRGRIGDVDTIEAFTAQEERELSSADPTTQQLLATEAKADHILLNDGSMEGLEEKVRALLSELS